MSNAQATIYVGNIPFNTDEDALRSFFNGRDIVNVKMPTDRETGRPRGFAFVTFSNEKEAKDALSLNGHEMQGRQLRIDLARS